MGKNINQEEETKAVGMTENGQIPEGTDVTTEKKKWNILGKVFNKENAIRAGFFVLGVGAKIGWDLVTGGCSDLPSVDAPALPEMPIPEVKAD